MSTRHIMGTDEDEWQHNTEGLIKLLKDSGATTMKRHIFADWWMSNIASWMFPGVTFQGKQTLVSDWLKKYGLLSFIQLMGHYSPPGGYPEYQHKAILNIDGVGDLWIAEALDIIQKLQPEIIGTMNEPYMNATLLAGWGLTAQQYYDAYRQFIIKSVDAYRTIKPDLVVVVCAMPFFDFQYLAVNPIPRPNVIYQTHYHYAFEGVYPPAYQPEMRAYWDATTPTQLAEAKRLLYQWFLVNERVQWMLDAGLPMLMGEIGGHILNPNILQYLQDAYDFAKDYHMGFLQHTFRAWDPILGGHQSGILMSDDPGNTRATWTRLNNTLGAVWLRNMPGAVPGVYSLTVTSNPSNIPFTITKVS